MLDVAKMEVVVPPPAAVEDIAIGALLAACDKQAAMPLIFNYEGRAIRPGYHVTEVRAAPARGARRWGKSGSVVGNLRSTLGHPRRHLSPYAGRKVRRDHQEGLGPRRSASRCPRHLRGK